MARMNLPICGGGAAVGARVRSRNEGKGLSGAVIKHPDTQPTPIRWRAGPGGCLGTLCVERGLGYWRSGCRSPSKMAPLGESGMGGFGGKVGVTHGPVLAY